MTATDASTPRGAAPGAGSEPGGRPTDRDGLKANADLTTANKNLHHALLDLAKQAAARLRRQQLNDMAQVTRTMAENATSRNGAEREIATQRWAMLTDGSAPTKTFVQAG